MSRSLAIYLTGLVGSAALALLATSLVFPLNPLIAIQLDADTGVASSTSLEVIVGLGFWTLVTLVASALPVRVTEGVQVAVSTAPLMAAAVLGGPTAAAWVALIGSTDIREVKGRVPWYGTLANHAAIVLPVIAGAIVIEVLRGPTLIRELVVMLLGTLAYFLLNLVFVSLIVVIRNGLSIREFLFRAETTNIWANLLTLAPLGWFMTKMYELGGWWTTLLFGLPLFTTRVAYQRFVEMREMFTQTIGALAEAVDKRDPFTAKHSHRVKEIAVDIGRVMHVGDAELEALEWGGLLHDVGKIGVPDRVLLKQERLNKDERMIMNAHPVLGAQIIAPVTKLAPELPIIRHHHEWYNGSGYPDRLIGDEIPKLARVLHVADAFEAMTAARPYRMTPLTAEQALAELRKFAGIQFDPVVVDAFVKTHHVEGVLDPGRTVQPRPIPLLGQAAATRLAEPPAAGSMPASSQAPEQA